MKRNEFFSFFFGQILKDTLTTLHDEGEENPYYQKVRTYVLNPKVCPLLVSSVSISRLK